MHVHGEALVKKSGQRWTWFPFFSFFSFAFTFVFAILIFEVDCFLVEELPGQLLCCFSLQSPQ